MNKTELIAAVAEASGKSKDTIIQTGVINTTFTKMKQNLFILQAAKERST